MTRDALVVGINNYLELTDLPKPARDAEAVAQLLEKYGDFRVRRLPEASINGKLCVDRDGELSCEELKKAIANLFNPEGEAPETALLFFAGHGLRESSGGITEGFLATSDSDPSVGFRGLSLQWLRRLLQQKNTVRQQIIWLDCCHSGELHNFDEADPGSLGKGKDRCFIAACRPFESAYESLSGEHGVLTEFLLQGLDPNNYADGVVTNNHLTDFIKEKFKGVPQAPIYSNPGDPIILTSRKLESVKPVREGICPYRGLRYFDFKQEDAEYFYGRTSDINDAIAKIRSHNFLAVLGPSGSGKSSLVRAGLLYQLKLGQKFSEDRWGSSDRWKIYPPFTPGEQDSSPLQNLARVFVDAEPELSPVERATQLKNAEELIFSGAEGLKRLIEATPAPRVVLTIDQFEEIFTLCEDDSERQKFFQCLLGALEQSNGKLCLVLVMRTDFLGKCVEQEHSGLADYMAKEEHKLTLRTMTAQDLHEAISKPAQQVGLEVDAGLIKQMVEDVQGSPGSLPLLQYTLTELWDQKTVSRLTLSEYNRLEGIKGALKKQADEVFQEFSEAEQKVAKRIFLELTQLGEGTDDTRRRVLKNELITTEYTEELVDRAIEKLVKARLVVTDELQPRGETGKVTVIDVAHESLIRHWPQLKSWLEESREMLRNQRRIEVEARQWVDGGKSHQPGDLLGGSRLVLAEEFWQQYPGELSSDAVDLIQLSQEARQLAEDEQKEAQLALERERQEKEIAQERAELERQQREQERQRAENEQREAQLALERERQEKEIAQERAELERQQREQERQRAENEQKEAQLALERERQEKETAQQKAELEEKRKKTAQEEAKILADANHFLEDANHVLEDANQKAKRTIKIGTIIGSGVLLTSFVFSGIFLASARIASDKQREAEEGTRLEQAGVSALRQLRSGELEALLSAMQSGQRLREIVKDDRLPQDYPAASPILALQKILDTIYERDRFDANGEEVKAASFSPNGETVATAGRDGIVRIWSLSGTERTKPVKLQGHLGGVLGGINDISFSADGQKIVSAGGDSTVRLWDTSGKQLAKMAHETVVNAVSFSPDGHFASGDDFGVVKLWDMSAGEKAKFDHPGGVSQISFSPNGEKIATAGKDGTVRLWNLSGKQVSQFKAHGQRVFDVTFSPDGQQLATAGDDNTARIWDLSGKEVQQLEGHQGWVIAVSFSPDGQRLATAGDDGTVRLWENSGREIARLQGHRGTVWQANFSPDGRYLVSAGRDGTSRLWDMSARTGVGVQFSGHQEDVNSVSFSPDGQRIIGSGDEGVVRIWDLSGEQVAQWTANSRGAVWSVSYSPDGKTIATAGYENTVRLWDSSGQPQGQLKGHESWVNSVSFSPDGQLIVTSGADKTARLWNLSGELLATLKGHEAVVGKVAFSPDGQRIVSTDWDGKIKLWDISGELQQEWQGHQGQIRSVSFSPDGQQLVTADNNSMVRLWDMSGRQQVEFFSYQSGINAVRFSPDGLYIATGGMDGTVRIWDLQGRQVAEFANQSGAVWGLSFSPDGQSIIAGGDAGSLQLWQVPGLDELLVAGCEWLEGYLANASQASQVREFCQE
ncbi:caspase family protein [Oxynema sp. CENA135]|uniref:nSTAND1 domain-containing NTPase n=1 Tax=Oxynema sp. CENA135 TaxID=984206 RepID=UPI00190DA526|nr:caspase family protein [Oxynema sp. CENA135]MBK4730817.1 caspase family protein [Oxynema sp. CENA135]